MLSIFFRRGTICSLATPKRNIIMFVYAVAKCIGITVVPVLVVLCFKMRKKIELTPRKNVFDFPTAKKLNPEACIEPSLG
mmetsp:Transcript_28037/g.68272  ORF Transcript_28037/g.68272 Transcript_28037/m.68272 type:complete len:80 (+) Transcript_28037:2303-2542(+)